MGGSSLGGLASCYAGWTRGEHWSPIIGMSNWFIWNKDFESDILSLPPPGVPAQHLYYIDWGTHEFDASMRRAMVQTSRAVSAKLRSLGWGPEDLHVFEQEGGI